MGCYGHDTGRIYPCAGGDKVRLREKGTDSCKDYVIFEYRKTYNAMINHNKPGKKPNEFGLSDEELIVYQRQVEAIISENQRKMKELLSSKDIKLNHHKLPSH